MFAWFSLGDFRGKEELPKGLYQAGGRKLLGARYALPRGLEYGLLLMESWFQGPRPGSLKEASSEVRAIPPEA